MWLRFIAPFLAWREYEYTAKSSFNLKIHGNCGELVERYIYYFGVWEPHITRCLRSRLSTGDLFVDVGANIGYFSLLASSLVGDTGRVVAIEASPNIFRALNEHLALNRIRNVRTVNVAVLDQRGTVSLFRGEQGNVGQTTTRAAAGRNFECEVKAEPLEQVLTAEEVSRARIIKIDVEGAEWAVVAGMGSILTNGRENLEIIVEVSPESLATLGKRPNDFFSLFAEYGYQPYLLETGASDSSYFSRSDGARLERIRNGIDKQVDVLFSHLDRDFLTG